MDERTLFMDIRAALSLVATSLNKYARAKGSASLLLMARMLDAAAAVIAAQYRVGRPD